MATLPKPWRRVVILRDVQGHPPAEVSAATGLTAKQQRDVLNRARELLRQTLGSALGSGSGPIMITEVAAAPRTLARRLLPLQIGVALQGLLLWIPIEKLFMTQIGFDAASVGAMAAAYAAVVPLLEVPSGILADRWSRCWVMILGCLALMISSLIGGLSHSVITYVIAAMILGIYFACSSGTVDSIVYDTVLEETGSNELYEKWIGRIRAVESGAFVLSALAGGVLAQYTSARFTYLATVPLVGLAIIAFLRFNEPRLHQAEERVTLRSHVALSPSEP